jgi:hypothetical protein
MLLHNEKRDFIRMAVDCDLVYQVLGSSEERIGKCLNLSGSGVLFVSDTPFDDGQMIVITLKPHNKLTPAFSATVEVIRCDKRAIDHFEIGSRIVSITDN